MESRVFVWVGMVLGSILGGLIPSLWGAGVFSFSSMFWSAAGAILGIWVGFRIANG